MFALSEKMLAPGAFFSTYHARQFVFTKFSSWLVAYQHWLYWPVMGIARANLYVQSLGTPLSTRAETSTAPRTMM